MNVEIEESDSKGRAYIGYKNEPDAEMTWSKAGDSMIIIDHTEVGENFKGNGLGRKLLNRVVDKARNENLKILPLCPYAKSVFDKDESIRDVL